MEERIVDLEKAIGKIEVYMESMSQSISKMADTMSDYKVIADRTTQNGTNIEKLYDKHADFERETRNMFDGHRRRHDDSMKDINLKTENDNDKRHRASELRLRWGIGLTITVTLSLFGTSIKMINSLEDKMDKSRTQNYYIERKVEELIEINKRIKNGNG